MVFQHYVHNPLLIYNKKFDLRMYVLISNVDPLIVYLHKEGLFIIFWIFETKALEGFALRNINNQHHKILKIFTCI